MAYEQIKVEVHAYDITIEPSVLDTTDGKERTNIHIWALTRESKPVLIRIDNYQMSCNIILPEFVGGYPFDWNPESVNGFLNFVANKLGDKRPSNYDFHKSSVIYYDHNGKKFPMIKFFFRTLDNMWSCSKLFGKPLTIYSLSPMPMSFNVCETNIDIVRKLMTERDCQYSQWFSIEGINIPIDSEYRIQVAGPKERPLIEILANYETLNPIPNSISSKWTTNPHIVAFDIEAYSNNHKAMPNEFNPIHCTNIITCVYQIKGQTKTRQKFAFVLGDCPNIDDAEIICVQNEDELYENMALLVREFCPEILIGFNIIGFDYRYIDTRLKNKMKQWPEMGRIKGKIPVIHEMNWKSSAYGTNKLSILQADGIISIDMYPLIKRDYKLDKYDLDFVSKHFIGRGKHEVKFSKMFQAHEKSMFVREMIEKVIGEIAVDDEELYHEIAQKKIDTYVESVSIRLELMQKALYSKKISTERKERIDKTIIRFAMARDELKKYVAYGLEDSTLCIDLFDKLNIWEGLIQLSNVVGVTIMQLFTRGQQIRFLSQVYHMATKMGFVINKRIANKLFFNGGFVFEPIPGLHKNVICLDFASLYPSIIMAHNICFSTLIPPEQSAKVTDDYAESIKFDQEEPRDGKPKKRNDDNDNNDFFDVEEPDHEEGEEKPDDIVTRSYDFKWVRRSVREGVLPRCERELTDGRKGVKKEIKIVEKTLEPYEDSIPYIDKAISSEKTLHILINEIKELIKDSTKQHDEMPAGKNKSIVKMNIEEYEGIMKILNENIEFSLAKVSENFTDFIKTTKIQLVVLDKRQNAMKTSANSMFGALGAQNGGVLPLIEGAMSITATGRRLIGQVNDYLKDKYKARIVYNDTDSVFVDMGIMDSKEAYARGIALSIEISGKPAKFDKDGNMTEPAVKGLFPPPLVMEFEKAMLVLCLKKKKYAALLINQDGTYQRDKKTNELYVLQRGIVLQRRDTCKYLYKVYREVLMAILQEKPIMYSYEIIMKAVANLIQGKIQARGNLTIIRELGSAYKSDNFCMKVFADHLQKLGRPANPGDRLEYVIVRTPEDDAGKDVKLGQKMRDFSLFEEALESEKRRKEGIIIETVEKINESLIFQDEDDPLKIPETMLGSYSLEKLDYMYYLEHLLTNALDQLFSISYREELKRLEGVVFQPFFNKRLRKVSPISEPLGMLSRMWQDYSYGGCTFEQFGEMIPELIPWFNNKYNETLATSE